MRCLQVDEFVVEAVTLKKLKKIRVGHNGDKAGSGWFLDKIVVHPVDDPSNAVVFECNRYRTYVHVMISPTSLGALCGQLTFRLACCREHSAVTATELLQPLDLACGTLFQSGCAIQTSPTDCSDDS